MALEKILLVDDDPDILMIVEMTLADCATFTLRTATDGLEAVQKCESWQPDLVLMDMKMPRLDGLQALAKIKATSTTAHIPVIMITANSVDTSQDSCLAQGAAAVFLKPFNPLTLVDDIYAEWQKIETVP